VVSFTSRPLYPQGESPWCPLNKRLGGPRAVLDAVVKRKIPSPRRESNPRTPIVQPVIKLPLLPINSGSKKETMRLHTSFLLLAPHGGKPCKYTECTWLPSDETVVDIDHIMPYRPIPRKFSWQLHQKEWTEGKKLKKTGKLYDRGWPNIK
jgi:hypothetical protein